MTEAEKQRADSITEMHFQRAWMQHLLDHKETEAALATRFFLAGIAWMTCRSAGHRHGGFRRRRREG